MKKILICTLNSKIKKKESILEIIFIWYYCQRFLPLAENRFGPKGKNWRCSNIEEVILTSQDASVFFIHSMHIVFKKIYVKYKLQLEREAQHLNQRCVRILKQIIEVHVHGNIMGIYSSINCR